jgi:manganese/zinc/iron transport system permease protein
VVVAGTIALIDLAFVVALWKELKATSFDPAWAGTVRIPPRALGRALLVMVAITAVTAFDAVGAILVVTLLIVPAAAAQLLATRLWAVVAVAVGIGWVAAVVGYEAALAVDASIAGAMGLVCAACFAVALLLSPEHGLIAKGLRRRRTRHGQPAPAAR